MQNDGGIEAQTVATDQAFRALTLMLNAQANAMRQLPQFTFSPDKQKGNAYYGVLSGGVHTFSYDLQYIYNALRNLWMNQQEEDNTTGIRPVVM